MFGLGTLIKETASDPNLIELNCCLEDSKTNQLPNDYKTVVEKFTHRWDCGIIMADYRIIMPKTLRYTAVNDELRLLPREDKLTPEQGILNGKTKTQEPSQPVRKSKRLPFAKQTEKLVRVSCHTNNSKRN